MCSVAGDRRVPHCVCFHALVNAFAVHLRKDKFSRCYKKMLPPLELLDDNAGNAYCLQLNLYKYILDPCAAFILAHGKR